MQTLTLKLGDCVQRMAEMPDSSIDSIVCDPPYGLRFMQDKAKGRTWDDLGDGAAQREWHKLWLAEAFRVLKPGGRLMAFNGTRTHHHLSMAMEQVGFIGREIRSWAYGSGFPKSLNVQKFLLKQANQEMIPETKANLEEKSNDFNGFGSALKPAWEPIVIARKPC